MSSFNGGILTNASPLTAEQIAALEQELLNTGGCYAYLDQNNNICFMSSTSPDNIKDLAWHNASELNTEAEIFYKKQYIKTGMSSFYLNQVLQKQAIDESWSAPELTASLLDVDTLENFILA